MKTSLPKMFGDRQKTSNVQEIIEHIKENSKYNLSCYSSVTYVMTRSIEIHLRSLFGESGEVFLRELEFDQKDGYINKPLGYEYEDPKKMFSLHCYNFLDGNTVEEILFVFYNDYSEIQKLLVDVKPTQLKPGLYQALSTSRGTVVNPINMENKPYEPMLNDGFQKKLLSDIKSFFDSEQFYRENNFKYKRGALLYGTAGTGKTSSIVYIASQLNVPTIFFDSTVDLDTYVKNLIENSCNNGVIVVLEDIDGVSTHRRTELLNFIDGVSSPDKCYFFATTNYIDRVDYAISNRPSRFDILEEVGMPNEDTRKTILSHYFKDKIDEQKLIEVAKLTKDFTGAYIKELYILYSLNKISVEEAVSLLKKRIDLVKNNKLETTSFSDDELGEDMWG